MSSVAITIQALLAAPGVTALVADRIYPIAAPPFNDPGEHHDDIIVNLIHEDDEMLLQGAARFPEARVSIECRSVSAASAIRIGEAVKTALQEIAGDTFAGRKAWFFKEGTDATERNDSVGLSRRHLDFYVRWK